MTLRIDRRTTLSPLAAPKSAMHFEGRVARVHAPDDPLHYSTGPEYRRADEVQRIVDQLPGTQVTMLHPKGMLSQGVEARVIGTVISARVDGEYAVAVIALDDEQAIKEVVDGVQQLSLGYTCNLDADRYQVGITVDHLATVPAARCGDSCALRVDDAMEPDMKKCPCGDPGCELGGNYDDVLTAAKRHGLTAEDFAVPGKEKLPIHDAAHVRAAMSRFSQTQGLSDEERRSAYSRIVARAHKLGIDTAGFEAAHKSDADCDCEMRVEACTCKSRATCNTDGQMDELKTQLAAAIAAAAADKVRADAAEKRANEETVRATEAQARLAQAEIDRDNAKRELVAETARVDAAIEQTKVESEKARQDAVSATTAAVAARVKLLTEANRVLGESDTRLDMLDRDIKLAVIKHVDGDDVPADKADLYVDGIYDGALKRHAKGTGSRADALVVINQMRQDGAAAVAAAADPLAREKAAAAALARSMSTAWQQKTQE